MTDKRSGYEGYFEVTFRVKHKSKDGMAHGENIYNNPDQAIRDGIRRSAAGYEVNIGIETAPIEGKPWGWLQRAQDLLPEGH